MRRLQLQRPGGGGVFPHVSSTSKLCFIEKFIENYESLALGLCSRPSREFLGYYSAESAAESLLVC